MGNTDMWKCIAIALAQQPKVNCTNVSPCGKILITFALGGETQLPVPQFQSSNGICSLLFRSEEYF